MHVRKPKKQPQPAKADNDEMQGNNSDGGDEGTSTYNKFKSHNEIEIGEAYKTGPARIILDDLDELVSFGHIVQYIQ